MRIVLSAVLSLVLLVASTVSATAESVHVEQRLAEITEAFVRNRGFNGVVLVASAGGVVLHQAKGLSSLELGVELEPDDVFRIGSLTKPLTAVLILSLVSEGRLRLDGSLGEYLPELYADTPASGVTIEQPLKHRSGLKDVPAT